MNLYLIDCSCKDKGDVWRFKSIVRSESSVFAWDKFIKKWHKDYEKGKADIPITAVADFKVEKICDESEAII